MKKLRTTMMMILLGLLFNCSPAVAEKYYASKPVVCGTMQEIVDMSSEFGELPIIKGEGTTLNDDGKFASSQYFIGLNEKTGTWTLIEILSTGHACILGRGSKLEVLSKKKGIEL
jgi:hypothetical protein